MKRLFIALITLCLPTSALVSAGELELSGYVAGEARGFIQSPAYPDQEDGVQMSLILEPELHYSSGGHTFTLIPFARWDDWDDERTHADLREAYWRYEFGDWEILTGADRVFWGVTESRHLVDIINQTDALEDIDNEDKLGQPMIALSTYKDWGALQLFLLPYFREREFPGREGRLRGPLPISENARYESSAEEWHQDLAIRYSHFIGDWDLGLHVFHGTAREPQLIPNEDGSELTPFYAIITQGGADIQYTHEAWLWKLEALVRDGQGDTFAAAVGGLEYTLYQIFGSDADLGLLTEYHKDERDETAPPTIYNDDIFAGLRLAANDTQDSQLLLGAVFDTENDSTFIFAEAERRFGNSWIVQLEARIFSNIDPEDPGTIFERDDFVSLSAQRHF